MNRDIRGEVLVAMVAVALLGFALAFGVLVSLSEPDDDIAPSRNTATMAVVDSNVDVATLPTITLSSTGTLSETPTQTTITSTLTSTLEKSTESPTVTEVTPSLTSTHTATPRPTRTPIPTHTPSNTPRPTEFALILPTLTPDATQRSTPVACESPADWVRFTVPTGTTLFAIAQATGSSIADLQVANCLPDPARIVSGDVLFVPRLPVMPVATPIVRSDRVVCDNPAVQISSPDAGQLVSGRVPVTGNAVYGDQFGYYKLEIRPDTRTIYNFYARSETPVMDAVLAYLDTTLFDRGTYWLRLVVVDRTGNVPFDATCVIPIVID